MFGLIIPAPLLMPVSVTVWPSIVTWRDAAFGSVSVVMIACAASYQFAALRFASAAGSPAFRRSIGSGSRITPVENGSTCAASRPARRASSAQVSRVFARPGSPVPAFALPVFTTSARMPAPPARTFARCSRHTITGAAQKRFSVNTPATVAPSSTEMTSTSLRFGLRMFASAQPSVTPATGCNWAGSIDGKLTAMGHTCRMENAGTRRHRLEEPAAAGTGRRNSHH